MTQQTKPSAGALRAAGAIHELSPEGAWYDSVQQGEGSLSAREINGVADIIDRETGVAELLEAAKDSLQYVRGMQKDAIEDHYFKLAENAGASAAILEQAIAKCDRSE